MVQEESENSMEHHGVPRNDYPRPQFQRDAWMSLNGEWEFGFDDRDEGIIQRWFQQHAFSQTINVPFAYQSKLSGIGETAMHDIVWYRKKVRIPNEFAGKRIMLHFGAVDYLAWVWVNGQLVKYHEGGHTPFSADITEALHDGENAITVKAQDFTRDVTLPRGKQFWEEKPRGIWYTPTTGIWQSVWLEAVSDIYLEKVKFTPDIDNNQIQVRAFIDRWHPGKDLRLKTRITFQGEEVLEDLVQIKSPEETREYKLHDFNDHGMGRWWSPERPNLYDVTFSLIADGQEIDHVKSYFGMRKISVEDGVVCLNNRPYKMKMVLDQGYFPDGLLTPPSDDAIRKDVELTKAMGFNGARKHQKVEDPRYLYWCDKLGLLVWGEMANAGQYSETYVRRMMSEWQEVIERDYNHPSIVAWVPINESWGVPNVLVDRQQQQHTLALYHLTKSLDPTRLVISNDGWEHTKSDLITIHDYEWREEVLARRYADRQTAIQSKPARRWIIVPGFQEEGEPVLVTEFGGISFRRSEWEGWGYSSASDEKEYIDRLNAVFHPLHQSEVIHGYCYTQLTDVEQEINGLLTYDRKPKVPLELIKRINQGQRPSYENNNAGQQHHALRK